MFSSLSPSRFATLLLRLLLAALLAYGSEVLVWTNPPARPLLEWLFLAPGYLILASILLDFIVRYRVRDLFGVLVLAGFYSLSAALVLNPESMLVDMPRTLVTRVMGAHGLLAAEMIGLFLALTGDSPRTRRALFIGCAAVGLAWGAWVRWWPADAGYADVSLLVMLLYGAGGLFIILALLSLSRRFAISLDDLRLSPVGWGMVVIVLTALLALRSVQGTLTPEPLILVALLLVLCWAILWFRGRTKGETLLDDCLPPRPPSVGILLLAVVIFFGTAVFFYNLPRFDLNGIDQLDLIGLGFTAYGLAWLPTVALVLGVQGYLRQLHTRRL